MMLCCAIALPYVATEIFTRLNNLWHAAGDPRLAHGRFWVGGPTSMYPPSPPHESVRVL